MTQLERNAAIREMMRHPKTDPGTEDPRRKLVELLTEETTRGTVRWYERSPGTGWVAECMGYRYTLSPDSSDEGDRYHRLEVRLLSCGARQEIMGRFGPFRDVMESLAREVSGKVTGTEVIEGALESFE